jgi:hypothetical protein
VAPAEGSDDDLPLGWGRPVAVGVAAYVLLFALSLCLPNPDFYVTDHPVSNYGQPFGYQIRVQGELASFYPSGLLKNSAVCGLLAAAAAVGARRLALRGDDHG